MPVLDNTLRRHRRLRWWLLGAIALAAALGAFRWRMLVQDPKVAVLLPHAEAKWIIRDYPVHHMIYKPTRVVWLFRTRIDIDAVPATAILNLHLFRGGEVRLDGRVIFAPPEKFDEWRKPLHVDLAPFLTPGMHEIVVKVANRDAPACLLANCSELNLRTDESWEVTYDGTNWSPARVATEPWQSDIVHGYPPAEIQLLHVLPVLLPVFLVVAAWTLLWRSSLELPWLRRLTPTASAIRWFLMAALAVMAINNFSKIEFDIGFDVVAHLEYIEYIIRHRSIPLATDGWQMFQSPLYYLVEALVFKVASIGLGPEATAKVVRCTTMLCAMAQVQLCYRIMRLLFPARTDLHAMGAVIGGFIPMNLYFGNSIGNEPLAGALTALVIYQALSFTYGEERHRSIRALLLMGTTLGLAMLAKVSAVLLIPSLLILFASVSWLQNTSWRRVAVNAAVVSGAAVVVAGWYYARNWILLGQPFVSGWDPQRQIVWWQDPGYRTLNDLLTFGRSLRWPFPAEVLGFWDAFYSTFWTDGFWSSRIDFESRPPWNDRFMVSGALLGLVPAMGMVAGALSACIGVIRLNRAAVIFSILCIGTYVAAMLDLYLRLPTYTTVKASYTMGLIPCYAILGVAGFSLIRHRVLWALAVGLIACWALGAYVAYFVW